MTCIYAARHDIHSNPYRGHNPLTFNSQVWPMEKTEIRVVTHQPYDATIECTGMRLGTVTASPLEMGGPPIGNREVGVFCTPTSKAEGWLCLAKWTTT